MHKSSVTHQSADSGLGKENFPKFPFPSKDMEATMMEEELCDRFHLTLLLNVFFLYNEVYLQIPVGTIFSIMSRNLKVNILL